MMVKVLLLPRRQVTESSVSVNQQSMSFSSVSTAQHKSFWYAFLVSYLFWELSWRLLVILKLVFIDEVLWAQICILGTCGKWLMESHLNSWLPAEKGQHIVCHEGLRFRFLPFLELWSILNIPLTTFPLSVKWKLHTVLRKTNGLIQTMLRSSECLVSALCHSVVAVSVMGQWETCPVMRTIFRKLGHLLGFLLLSMYVIRHSIPSGS